MHHASCHCCAHDPNGNIERTIAAALRANKARLWAIRGSDARLAHESDRMTLDRLAADSGVV